MLAHISIYGHDVLYMDIQLFRQRLSNKSGKAYAFMPIGIMGSKS